MEGTRAGTWLGQISTVGADDSLDLYRVLLFCHKLEREIRFRMLVCQDASMERGRKILAALEMHTQVFFLGTFQLAPIIKLVSVFVCVREKETQREKCSWRCENSSLANLLRSKAMLKTWGVSACTYLGIR